MKKSRYSIMATMKVDAGIIITADSLEDAIAEARELKVTDFIEFVDEYLNEDTFRITGVYEA